MQASENAFALIKQFEGLRLNSYQDVAGVWTIGYGCTTGIKPNETITEAEAETMLEQAVQHVADVLDSEIHATVTQNQFDACVCFAYNVGTGAFHTSTLLRKVNEDDTSGAAAEFSKWVHAGGAILPGLVKRRLAERDLFLTT